MINIKQTQRHLRRSFVSSYSIKIFICFLFVLLQRSFSYIVEYMFVCFYGSPMRECMCLFLHEFLALFLLFPNLFFSYSILFYLILFYFSYCYSLVPCFLSKDKWNEYGFIEKMNCKDLTGVLSWETLIRIYHMKIISFQ